MAHQARTATERHPQERRHGPAPPRTAPLAADEEPPCAHGPVGDYEKTFNDDLLNFLRG
ncbi:hypothetical protein ACFU3E_04560 [Streptomyces sp. NPDC057424]|uniref:hypothetical protein n=1 Tax=Streptomyces sp. NPDC057424 TaxID=3346127 RepID=UPI00367BDC6C